MEASTRKLLRPVARLARRALLAPLLAGVALLCLLLAVVISFGQPSKKGNPLTPDTHYELERQLAIDLEGMPTAADVRRAQRPPSERRRLLAAHPSTALYEIARRRFGVSLFLLAAVHYQDTGFASAPAKLASMPAWRRHRHAMRGMKRPARYPHRSRRHPSITDDFDLVMATAAALKGGGARVVDDAARRALTARYGAGPQGRLTAAVVLERARAWQLIGRLPMPGRGELATPVKGVVGGCGYFGCPRPGHLHNGVDFLAPAGTSIRAAETGHVALLESTAQSGGYGNFVCLQHRPHLATCYAHLSTFAEGIAPGARVRRGQVIGLVGSTGSSSAPHLHFEVRRGAAACAACAVDPLALLSGDAPRVTAPPGFASAAARPAARQRPGAPAPDAPAPVAPPPRAAQDPDPDHEPRGDAAPGRARSSPSAKTDGRARSRKPSPSRPAPAPAPPRWSAPPPSDGGATGGTSPTTAPPVAPAPADAPAPAPPPPAPPPDYRS